MKSGCNWRKISRESKCRKIPIVHYTDRLLITPLYRILSPLQAISEIVRYFKQNVRIPADTASNAAPPGIL